jgi:acyl-coenzyme A thioesterase PaaI-like protein
MVATLDLRIDYLKPAVSGQDLHAYAHCYKTTRNIAFTRAIAYQGDVDDPIAHASGSFMMSSTSKSTMKPA